MAEAQTPDQDLINQLRRAVVAAEIARPPKVSGSSVTEAIVDPDLEKRLAPLVAKASRLVNHRDRSVAEMRSRLSEMLDEGDDPRLVETVIERCLSNGMLNDERFAREWVRQRQRLQKKSVTVLRRELRDKGIAQAIAERALDQIDQADQDYILHTLVHRKAASVSTVPVGRAEYDKVLRRIIGVAARRGFPSGPAMAAAKEALNNRIGELSGTEGQ